jgi:cytochrome c oxidase subunit II
MNGGRRRLLGWAAAGAVLGAGLPASAVAGKRVEIEARKFEFTPSEVTVPAGAPVTFVLRALDFPHGFSMPDFNLRRDLIPGGVVEVTITPGKPGRYHFLCDNFCGEGHERMGGILVVT